MREGSTGFLRDSADILPAVADQSDLAREYLSDDPLRSVHRTGPPNPSSLEHFSLGRHTTKVDPRMSETQHVDNILQRILAMENRSTRVDRSRRAAFVNKKDPELQNIRGYLAQFRMKHLRAMSN